MPGPVDYSTLLADARMFLSDLADNNSRDWFNANKGRYDSLLKRPSERLLADVAPFLEEQTGGPVRRKLFRPHRDVRFSEDKTPYHTHLHLMWSRPDGRAWMLGLSAEYATAGAGIMRFENHQLDRWRDHVSGPEGEGLEHPLNAGGWRLDAPDLKRVPQPFSADHPRADLLRRKGLVVWRDGLDAGLMDDPLATLRNSFADMTPVSDWLATIA